MQVERALRTGGSVLFGDYKDLTEVDMVEILKQRWISLVPTQLHVLLNSSLGLKNLRSSIGIFVGGAELPHAIEMKAREADIPLWPCYGMTETAGMITALDSDSFLDHGTGVGNCLSHSRHLILFCFVFITEIYIQQVMKKWKLQKLEMVLILILTVTTECTMEKRYQDFLNIHIVVLKLLQQLWKQSLIHI